MHMNANIWIAICFTIFVILIFRIAKRGLNKTLDNKINQIKSDIEKSAQIKEEAEKILAQAKDLLSTIEEKKKDILTQAEIFANQAIEKKQQKFNLSIENQKNTLKKEVSYLTNKAVEKMTSEMTEKIMSIVKNYIKANKNRLPRDDKIALDLLSKHYKKLDDKETLPSTKNH